MMKIRQQMLLTTGLWRYCQYLLLFALVVMLMLGLAGHQRARAADLPGQGVTVIPIRSLIEEETFQTLLVVKALEKLGYDVKPMEVADYNLAYQALAAGDATFMAASWKPLHDNFYKGSGGDAKLFREGVYSDKALQGYLIDKATAEKYNITNIEQLKDPQIAQLFDSDGDGKADLIGCTPGWGCHETIEYQMQAYGLNATVKANHGTYPAMMAATIARYKEGKPILYYTWTPYWVGAVLRPGRDVVWLQVPFSALPGDQKGIDTELKNSKNYGFAIGTQHIVANRDFAQKNPAAAKLFSIMQLPVADINAQNLRMKNGEHSRRDIERHVDGWILGHQDIFNGWIEEAKKAAQ